MRRRKLLARGGLAVLLLAALLTTAQSSQADDEPEWYPGLPDATFGSWANAGQGGLSYARRAKQWFRTPAAMVVAEVASLANSDDLSSGQVRAEGYFVSPKGAPANYGYLAPMTVRSVGFGLMPVEATVQVSQRRAGDYPAPLKVLLDRKFYESNPRPGFQNYDHVTYLETVIADSLNVRILSVRVDGVDLELNGDCRTVEPAPVTLRTPLYDRPVGDEKEWYRTHDPSTYWDAIFGGEMKGSMTIPPFTGCTTTAGDDLSRLMTLSVSGADNPVVARSGWACDLSVNGAPAPLPPGASSPKLATEAGAKAGGLTDYCPGPKPFDYPEREDR
ncbi:hypothetical protein GCM10023350_50320 [Nocardioides endophyticus]|uniref:Secreted protein n=1 Tax=Nocardioides endophyticus TaxID=1353775 RepID=A0ABP8ZJJ2_9ACTN